MCRKDLKVLEEGQQSVFLWLLQLWRIEWRLKTSFSRPRAPRCFFFFLNSQQRGVVCNTPSTWLPRGRQVEDRSRAPHTTQHLVCTRRVRAGPFQAVKASPSLSLPRPWLSHCFGCSPRRLTARSLFPGSLEAAEELSRYHEMSALGAQ